MEYLSKPEIIEFLEGYRKNIVLQGQDGKVITEIIREINTFYTFRPTLQAQWVRKGRDNTISCSRCGFKTLLYKNTPFCPYCGRNMANGKKKNDER